MFQLITDTIPKYLVYSSWSGLGRLVLAWLESSGAGCPLVCPVCFSRSRYPMSCDIPCRTVDLSNLTTKLENWKGKKKEQKIDWGELALPTSCIYHKCVCVCWILKYCIFICTQCKCDYLYLYFKNTFVPYIYV